MLFPCCCQAAPCCSLRPLNSHLACPIPSQFWRHCYGADGNGGTVATASAAAQQVLHELCCVPLDDVAPGEFADQLFKGRREVASALSVRAFLERQQQVRGEATFGGEGRGGGKPLKRGTVPSWGWEAQFLAAVHFLKLLASSPFAAGCHRGGSHAECGACCSVCARER